MTLGGDDGELFLQACQYGFFSVAKFLLHYQSDDSKNRFLRWAVKEYHNDVIKLLNNGNAKLGSTSLHEAAQKGKEGLTLLNEDVVNLFLADPNINISHVKYKDFTIAKSQLKFLNKLQQDNALFNKVEEAANEKDTSKRDELLKGVEKLLKPENKYGFKPSLNYSPNVSGKGATVDAAIKAGGKLLQLLYDYAEKNISTDTKIFKQLKQAKEHSQPNRNLYDVSLSNPLGLNSKLSM